MRIAKVILSTHVTQGGKTASGLEEAQANVCTQVGPWRNLRTLFEDTDELREDERHEEVDHSSQNHNQKAYELKLGVSVKSRDKNVLHARQGTEVRSSSMAKDTV